MFDTIKVTGRLLLAGMLSLAVAAGKAQNLSAYVNPMIGASSSAAAAGTYHGLGKTFPGATTPYGMVQVSPNTITGGDNGSGYSDEHTSIEGFALTQMSGVGWYGDMGNFLVIPSSGPLMTVAGKADGSTAGYRSAYDKQSERTSAGYYRVLLAKHHIEAEMTAAPHSGMLRFSFPKGAVQRIQIDLARRVGGTSTLQYVKVVDDHTIEGWMKCTPDGGGWGDGDGHADYTVYFYAQFSKPMKDHGVWAADIPDDWRRKREDVESDKYQSQIVKAAVLKGIKEKEGRHLGFFAGFEPGDNEQVEIRAGISYVDIAGAKNNLRSEINTWNFDAIHQRAVASWDKALSKIKVEGGTPEQKTVFYTALYHTMIDPRIITDVDGRYPGGDGKIHRSIGFKKRTVFSGWDVYRSQMPLQTIINPALVGDMINSLVTLASEKHKDYLERWELLNAYSGCMFGNPGVSVIADAYAKGIRNYDVAKAYNLCVGSVERFGNGDRGYAPQPNSIALTLEYAYAEWCVSQLAKWTGHSSDIAKYAARSKSYKNIFDKEKGWFRPKDSTGNWAAWPDSGRLTQWYGTFEANPYQQGWFVPHDIGGMVKLMGGRQKVIADLDHFFARTPENMMWNDYYNHANEPVHHVAFLYNRLGMPWLTQQWSRAICRRAYHNSVEGLVGNEDVGQMSAWYVLAASGLHPVCPGDTRQEITSPVFGRIAIQIPSANGVAKIFTITALHNNEQNIYIQSARLNGKPYNKCYLDYKDVAAGGRLELTMGPRPNMSWGTSGKGLKD